MREIIFVGDPMCSWCWGFAPVLAQLRETFREDRFSMVMGGLRSEDESAWDEAFRAYLGKQWHQVAEITGQPFCEAVLARKHFAYDTEPACRAVVAMRSVAPEHQFDYFHRLQRAFYSEGADIREESVLAALSEDFCTAADFLSAFQSEAVKHQTYSDRVKAKTLGVTAFPSLVVIDEEGHLNLIRGYRSFESCYKLLQP